MNKKIYYLVFLVLILSCSDEPNSDSELLKKDRRELSEHLKSFKVSSYKFGKIMIRASVADDNTNSELKTSKVDIDRVSNKLVKEEELSVMDYISIYRDYKKMEEFIDQTDEDEFPTLFEAINIINNDSISSNKFLLEGDQKIYAQNIEHSILSIFVLLTKDLGKEIALYECFKTKPNLLPDSEIKTLLQFVRGFLFFQKNFYYLSENEISRNISWLNENNNIDLPYTRAFFKWGNLNNQDTHIAFHAINHLFRGFDRLMMEREIDEKRALQDFEKFLNDCNKIGLDNEVVWSVETYLYLKKEKNDKAIASLKKLKTSNLLSSSDKATIDESITYLENRKPESVLNGVYDKYFLSKIATKYMLSILTKIDWEKVLKEQNIQGTEQIFNTLRNFEDLIKKFENYPSTKDIEEKTSNLWDKAKELTE